MKKYSLYLVILLAVVLSSCTQTEQTNPPSTSGELNVLATMSFLADIAQNVAGERLTVDVLVPMGTDPHSYDPTPADAARLEKCEVLIINGAGFEEFLQPVLEGSESDRQVIDASAGLTGRTPTLGEAVDSEHPIDPHFWLDPTLVIRYVENIRDGLSQVDPEYAEQYRLNAEAYIEELRELDTWIAEQIASIPAENRVIVTNHESLDYFTDHYGLTIAGTIIPSVSSEASPSAQEIAGLVDQIRTSGARAVFLETGSNSRLAEQIARETGIVVAPPLYTHSLTEAGGEAPTYIEMMKVNTAILINSLK